MRKKETRHDFFYRKAKKEQYKSRAVYKLQEIHQVYKIFKRGGKVVDLCAHPGGWSQFARKKVGSDGIVIAVDLHPVNIPGIIPIVGDITYEETILQIEEALQGKCDVLLSDCSPNVSGHWGTDHARQIFLAQTSLELASKLLKKNGTFICKVFQGDLSNEHLRLTRNFFKTVKTVKPKASRKRSAEMYFVARGLLQ